MPARLHSCWGFECSRVQVLQVYMSINLGFPELTSAGTFSIAYGVIADISTPAERGSYVSALSIG